MTTKKKKTNDGDVVPVKDSIFESGGTIVGEADAAAYGPSSAPDNPMVLIADAVNRGADADVMERLFNLHERWEKKQAKAAFDDAITLFQRKCPQIRKDRRGMHGTKYASYDDIMQVIRGLLHECGLSISFDSHFEEGAMRITCKVSGHGHTEESGATLAMPKEMKVNDTQRMGAALTYGRRYTLCNALNIVVTEEDRDGVGLEGDKIEYMTEEQVFKLGVMLDALEDVEPGVKDRFTEYLMSLAGVDGLDACPARYYGDVESKLKTKMKEAGLN